MKVKIKNNQIKEAMNWEYYNFPKYSTMVINQVNQVARGTSKKIVGQISDLVIESNAKNLNDWIVFHNSLFPDAVEEATNKILDKAQEMEMTAPYLNREIVKEWVKDLLYPKSFFGIYMQEYILKRIANDRNVEYKLATPEEESKNIDGWIGDIPVSVKPNTWREDISIYDINVKLITYKKNKDNVEFEFDF